MAVAETLNVVRSLCSQSGGRFLEETCHLCPCVPARVRDGPRSTDQCFEAHRASNGDYLLLIQCHSVFSLPRLAKKIGDRKSVV